MNELYSRSWWVLALRGGIAILFGLLALFWPGLTLLGLVALFAAYALLGGAVSVIGALRDRKRDEDWGLPFLLGLVSIGAGVIAVMHPQLTALVVILLIGANALITGMLDIVAAIRLRKAIRNEWMLALSGIAAVAFGVLVFLFPQAGALAVIWLISIYALVTGILLLSLGFRLRSTGGRYAGLERRITPDRRVSATPVHP